MALTPSQVPRSGSQGRHSVPVVHCPSTPSEWDQHPAPGGEAAMQNVSMSTHLTAEALCQYLGVSKSPVFTHWSVAGSYLNTSDNLLTSHNPPENTITAVGSCVINIPYGQSSAKLHVILSSVLYFQRCNDKQTDNNRTYRYASQIKITRSVLTCNYEVTMDAHTGQVTSGGGEVTSRAPLSGASGPGLGGGQVISVVSSTYDINLITSYIFILSTQNSTTEVVPFFYILHYNTRYTLLYSLAVQCVRRNHRHDSIWLC